MRIDLSCPVEMLRFELSRDDNLKVRAYLTLNNLSEHAVLRIEGDVLWEDLVHDETMIQPISFDALNAPGKSRFRMQVSTDQLPGANRVCLMVNAVEFEDGSIWQASEDGISDIEPPLPPPGSELNKLIALAGLDASNYPMKTGSYWVCVCGRPNLIDAQSCVRCDRDQDEVMESFSRKVVLEAELPTRETEKVEVEIPSFLYDRQSPEQDKRERIQLELQMLESRFRSQRALLVRRSVFLVMAVLTVLVLAYAFDWLSEKQQFSQGFRQPTKIEGTAKPTLMPTPTPTDAPLEPSPVPTEAPPARPQNPIPAQPRIVKPA